MLPSGLSGGGLSAVQGALALSLAPTRSTFQRHLVTALCSLYFAGLAFRGVLHSGFIGLCPRLLGSSSAPHAHAGASRSLEATPAVGCRGTGGAAGGAFIIRGCEKISVKHLGVHGAV